MSARTRIGVILALVISYTFAIPIISFLVTFWLIVSWFRMIWRSMNWEPEWPLDYYLIKPTKPRQSLTEITGTVDEEGDVRR